MFFLLDFFCILSFGALLNFYFFSRSGDPSAFYRYTFYQYNPRLPILAVNSGYGKTERQMREKEEMH